MRDLRWRSAAFAGIAAFVTALALSAPVRADETPDSTDARVRRLEEALQRQADQMDGMRREFDAYRDQNPAVPRLSEDEIHSAVDAYLATAPASLVPIGGSGAVRGIRWGGYMTFDWRSETDDENSTFNVHRIILKGDADVTDRIDFEFEIEFENGGITDEVPGEIAIEQAELSFHVCDAFTPIAGAILIPFGRYNLYHDDPLNDFTDRPFTAVFMIPTGYAQPGIGARGSAPFGRGHTFQYKVAVTDGYFDGFNATEGVRDARQPWDADNNNGKQVWGRASATWALCALDYLETGVSGTAGTYDDADKNTLTGYGFDILARKGPFELQAEYLRQDYERNASDPPDAVKSQWAMYAQLAYHFFPDFWRCRRGALMTDTSLFTLAVRYEMQDLDGDVTGATYEDDLKAFAIALNYRVTERTVLRVDWTQYESEGFADKDQWTFSISTYF